MAEIITKDCKEYHIWDKVNGVWNRLFFKTNAKSVEADDGKELQTKVGALNGITSDLSCEDESIAISAKAVNDSLNRLDNNLEWKLAGISTGSNVVLLPESFNELMIEVKAPTDINYSYTYNILKQMLSDTEKRFFNGFYYKKGETGTQFYGVSKLNVSLTTVKLSEFFSYYNNETSSCTIYVYYR